MCMLRLAHLIVIVPIAVLLTASFFVLFTLRKTEEKWLKGFGNEQFLAVDKRLFEVDTYGRFPWHNRIILHKMGGIEENRTYKKKHVCYQKSRQHILERR